ncbi:MAG: C39 family peptidase [Candidatus Riflebacteria bacterium]|nr:C39 family peptidase [Candidatus Riflebacteria bacterium]
MISKKLFLSIIFCFSLFNLSYAENIETADSPFKDSDVKVEKVSSDLKILDIETAKVAGITEIQKGYPKEGVLSGLGASFLRLRSWPWGNVIGQYYQGTKVSILGESGEFYLVEVNGQQGYMHKNYVSTNEKTAPGTEPYYPKDTKNGGFVSLQDGVDYSSGKKKETVVPTTSTNTTVTSDSNVNVGGKQTGSNGKVVLTVPKQCQGNVKCPSPWTACGPTALAMAMSYYNGQNVSQLSTKMYTATGCTKYGSGYDGLVNAAKKNGFPNAKWNGKCTQSWVRQKLQEGTPLVAHVRNHFVVIKGIDNNGNIIINDPAKSYVEETQSWSKFSAWWESKFCLTLK